MPKDEDLLGKMVEVEIVETGKHYLKGRLLAPTNQAVRPDVPPPLKKGQVSGLPEVSCVSLWMPPFDGYEKS